MADERKPASSEETDFQRHCKRAAKAWSIRDQWQQILLDCYDFIAPFRLSTRWMTKTPADRTSRIFDPTAVVGLERASGRLQQDLFPAGEPFFALEPGPAADPVAKEKGQDIGQIKAELEGVTNQIAPVFLNGDWDQGVGETIYDSLISFGILLILEGDANQPVKFVNVSLDEVALDQGPYNRGDGVFWKRKWSYRTIKEAFPKGTYDDAFNQAWNSQPETEVVLCQDIVWNHVALRWVLRVYLEKAEAMIWTETSRECPAVVMIYRRLPGQAYGFGPALMALPMVKTLNKAVELTLKAAALAMSGIFTRVDDGVFNPDTARIEPGAFWAVARNGGTLGPSIQKLDPPGDLNLSNLVLQDLRMQVQSVLGDQQLPPDGQSPRAAAEIVERIKRLAESRAGAGGRLLHSTVGVVRRTAEVLEKQGVLKKQLIIDNLLVKLRVISPLAQAFRAERALKYVNWLGIIGQTAGPQTAHLVTPVEQGLAEVGEDLGVPAHLIFTSTQQDNIQSTIKTLVAQGVAAGLKAQQAPPVPNGDPAQGAAQ